MRRLILPFLLLITILAVFFWGAHTNLQLNAANAASNLPINLKAQNKNLVILVDRIDLDQPSLRNVWLVLSKSPGSTLTFLPIYPNSSSNQQPPDQQLKDTFSMAENGTPADIFMNVLRNKGISWKHYIIVDDVLIAKGIDLAGGIKINDREIPASDVLSGNFYSDQVGNETEVIQSFLINNLCQRMPIISLHPDYEDFLLTVLSHSRSSFSFDEIIFNLRTISQNDFHLECQFPTISNFSDE